MPWDERPSAAASACPGPRPESWISRVRLFERKVLDNYIYSVPGEVRCQLLGQVHGAVLSAGATEGNHQALKSAALIVAHAGIHHGNHAGEKLVHGFLPLQIFDYRRVFSGQFLETFFAAGVRQAASIKDESAAVAGIVFGRCMV